VLGVDVPFWPTFWPAFVSGIAATVIGGGLLLVIGYWLIDRRLHFRDRADRVAEEDKRTKALRDAGLNIAYQELKSIAANLRVFSDAIAKDAVPYPPFDDNGWVLLSQAQALATVRPSTAEALMNAYNRVRSANGQLAEFADLTTGPSAALVNSALAATADEDGNLSPLAEKIHDAYEIRRADLRRGLVARLTDLRQHVDAAIDEIEAELGNALEAPSAQREYLSMEPVHDLTKEE
jgi:hypothetical protein